MTLLQREGHPAPCGRFNGALDARGVFQQPVALSVRKPLPAQGVGKDRADFFHSVCRVFHANRGRGLRLTRDGGRTCRRFRIPGQGDEPLKTLPHLLPERGQIRGGAERPLVKRHVPPVEQKGEGERLA